MANPADTAIRMQFGLTCAWMVSGSKSTVYRNVPGGRRISESISTDESQLPRLRNDRMRSGVTQPSFPGPKTSTRCFFEQPKSARFAESEEARLKQLSSLQVCKASA